VTRTTSNPSTPAPDRCAPAKAAETPRAHSRRRRTGGGDPAAVAERGGRRAIAGARLGCLEHATPTEPATCPTRDSGAIAGLTSRPTRRALPRVGFAVIPWLRRQRRGDWCSCPCACTMTRSRWRTRSSAAFSRHKCRISPTCHRIWLEGNCPVRDGRLCGIVDWGSACAGDPAVDVHVVRSPLFTDGSRRAFLHALDVGQVRLGDNPLRANRTMGSFVIRYEPIHPSRAGPRSRRVATVRDARAPPVSWRPSRIRSSPNSNSFP
jgi:hypothetical protein